MNRQSVHRLAPFITKAQRPRTYHAFRTRGSGTAASLSRRIFVGIASLLSRVFACGCFFFVLFFFAHRAAACCADVYANGGRGGLHSASLQNTELTRPQMLNNLGYAISGLKKKKTRKEKKTTICNKGCEIMMTCRTGC